MRIETFKLRWGELTKTPSKIEKIIDLRIKGNSIEAISKITKTARNTIKRYLRQYNLLGYPYNSNRQCPHLPNPFFAPKYKNQNDVLRRENANLTLTTQKVEQQNASNLEDLSKKITEQGQQINDLNQNNKQLIEKLKNASEREESLKSDKENLSKENKKLSDGVTQLLDGIEKYQEREKEFEKTLYTVRQNCEGLVTGMQKKNDKYERESKANITQLKSEIETLNYRLRNITNEKDNLERKNRGFEESKKNQWKTDLFSFTLGMAAGIGLHKGVTQLLHRPTASHIGSYISPIIPIRDTIPVYQEAAIQPIVQADTVPLELNPLNSTSAEPTILNQGENTDINRQIPSTQEIETAQPATLDSTTPDEFSNTPETIVPTMEMNLPNRTNSEVSFSHEEGIKDITPILNIGNPVYASYPASWPASTSILPIDQTGPYLLQRIRTLEGIPFQEYLGRFFDYLGYRVERTKKGGEMGGDLIIQRNDDRIAIQSKQKKENVGVNAIMEAYAAKGFYDATRARVIITSKFTWRALKLAQKLGVECWDGERLLQELYSYRYFCFP